MTEALDGKWDYIERKCLLAEEKMETNKLNKMEDEVIAEPEIYIYKDQQRALQLGNDDDISAETRLTKGDVAPPPATTEDVSEMTGSTRESKS